MVMHARKLPRLNDGYYERNQTHPYQNSGKYPSKSNYYERYNDKIRDSPSNGSTVRSDSPGRQSPRSYRNKSSHIQRKERHERGSSKSPNEKTPHPTSTHNSNFISADHHDNSERNNSEEKKQIGDWTEHVSSSGKIYYYNCKSEVSQWEKPKEWIDHERQMGISKSNESNKNKEKSQEKQSSSNKADKHSSTSEKSRTSTQHRTKLDDRPHKTRSITNEHLLRISREQQPDSQLSRTHSSEHLHASQSDNYKSPKKEVDRTTENSGIKNNGEGMEMCSNLFKIFLKRICKDSHWLGILQKNKTQTLDYCGNTLGTPEEPQDISPPASTQSNSKTSLSQTAVALANLPKLLSQLTGNKSNATLDKGEITQETLQTLQALLLTRQVSLNQQTNVQSPRVSETASPFQSQASPRSTSQASVSGAQTSHPTSGHSNNQNEKDDKIQASPSSEHSHRSSRRGSPSSSISSIHGIPSTSTSSLASAVVKPPTIQLTPSLANYFDENLISHVSGWQADHAERQVHRYSEESHTIGSLHCTQVSAELKSARSWVRVAEIQATLQEQRILFLEQQIKELEQLRSLNTFMSS